MPISSTTEIDRQERFIFYPLNVTIDQDLRGKWFVEVDKHDQTGKPSPDNSKALVDGSKPTPCWDKVVLD
ncbi:hypothetical protein ERO13_A03G103850v2 [Gossypium hirsutum]|nr:hypothetical protein ERO13_A03G103850v2 [Gossypium hirsutum]